MSASCSPALARKTSLDTSGNTETLSNTNNEEEGCSEAVSSMSNQVRKIFVFLKQWDNMLAFPVSLLHMLQTSFFR